MRRLAGRLQRCWTRGGDLTASPAASRIRILFIFLDGLGIGSSDPAENPIAAAHLPHLEALIGRERLLSGRIEQTGESAGFRPIDACLGLPGLPQSGTGQTTLLTGTNAAALMGRHFGPWVPTAVRDLLASRNIFSTARAAGARVRFANAYPSWASERAERVRRPGAFPLAARSASMLDFEEEAVRRGEALVSSITTESWRRYVDPDAPVITPREAGSRLARMAADNDLTIFAHYDTDYIGHRGSFAEAVTAIERVDGLLGGVAVDQSADTLVLVTSDHGNLEDARKGHTRNPVPLIAFGPAFDEALRDIESLTDLAPFILRKVAVGSV